MFLHAPLDVRQGAAHGRLGRQLDLDVEGREDVQTGRIEVTRTVFARQLTTHQRHERRVFVITTAGPAAQLERMHAQAFEIRRRNQVRLREQAQHHITTCLGLLGMAARIVDRRALDHADQSRRFQPVEFAHGLGEIKMRGQFETVDGAIAVLAEKHFVDIGLDDFFFAVLPLERDRHQHLVHLAQHRALVTQVQILDQLLGQGTAALHHPLRQQIHAEGAQQTDEVDAMMLEEAPVLDRDQGGDERLGHFVESEQLAVIEALRIDAPDLGRLEAHQIDGLAVVTVDHGLRQLAGKADLDMATDFGKVPELETAREELDALTIHHVLTNCGGPRDALIAERVELAQQPLTRHVGARIEFERSREDARRQHPLPVFKSAGDLAVEPQPVGQSNQHQPDQEMAQEETRAAKARRSGRPWRLG